MLIEEIDDVGLEAFKGGVGYFLNVPGSAIEAGLFARRVDLEAELGRDRQLIPEGSECLAYQFFIRVGPVDLGRVEECDSLIDGGADHGDPLLLIDGGSIAKAQTHASETDR